jgi:large subunit ribosomal protein L18
MSTSPTYNVKFRRRREGKTDYKKRLALLKSKKPRLVVRRSHNNIVAEIVSYNPQGDVVKSFFAATGLKKLGWKGHTGNIPAAYLAGYACAKKAIKGGMKEAVLDIGLTSPVHGSAVFSALKGAVEAGLSVPLNAEVLPSDDRAKGKHISEEIARNFEEVKSKIDKEFG